MFKSYEWLTGPCTINEIYHTRKLIDDDFECEISCGPGKDFQALIKEYENRKLNVGKNLALATIWFGVESVTTIEALIYWQDETLKSCFKKHPEYKIERDDFLKKMLVWV